MKHGKNYVASAKQVDAEQKYMPSEAVGLVKKAAFAKFDETVEVHFNLGIDPRHADQLVRGTLMLPHGTGKDVRIVVLTTDDRAKDALAAGAIEAGSDELIEKISGGWLGFDIVIASPDIMSKVGRLGKTLGARGLMPSPKSGTVTPDVSKAVKEFMSGKQEFRNDKTGIVHLVIGKVGFTDRQLKENFETVYSVIQKAKPTKAKGLYMKSIVMTSTMGPGVKVEQADNKWKEKS
ncbi:50S ribosomal protein L1 [bacterium]|jgi:large subunit ribosomal protein L1|nr:50S ribosomal protein L1 [bacterium]